MRPLMELAAWLGHNEALRLLLDREATLPPSDTGKTNDWFRRNALTAACGAAQLSTVQLLLYLAPPIDI